MQHNTPSSESPSSPRPIDPQAPSERAPLSWRHHRNTLWKVLKYAGVRAEEKKLTQVAASLTYTTVLSIVPMLAVVLSLFTAFPLFSDFRYALETFMASNVMPDVVSETVMGYLNQFAAKASGLTTIGGLFLIVTSVMLFRTIDDAFNDIWQVETRRPLRQRVLVYWAVLSLGPILAGGSLWALSVLTRESLGLMNDIPAIGNVALTLLPLLLTGSGFTALFLMVPNRSVQWKDALAGGFLTALILEILRVGIAFYLTRFPSYTVIYGTFAAIPIFLLWVYLSWLVILLGATVTALLPALRQRRWAQQHYTGDDFVDGVRILRVLWEAWNTQAPGRDVSTLCDVLGMHQDELDNVLHRLKQLGYVVNTELNGIDTWVLACDPGRADLNAMIDSWLIDRQQPGVKDIPQIIPAVSKALSGQPQTLETILSGRSHYHNAPSWCTIQTTFPTESPGEKNVESQ